jgi:hypothetical protein
MDTSYDLTPKISAAIHVSSASEKGEPQVEIVLQRVTMKKPGQIAEEGIS